MQLPKHGGAITRVKRLRAAITDDLALTVAVALGVLLGGVMWSVYDWSVPASAGEIASLGLSAPKAGALVLLFVVSALAPRVFAWRVLGQQADPSRTEGSE